MNPAVHPLALLVAMLARSSCRPPITLVALGHTPYSTGGFECYEPLIEAIYRAWADFTVHVGDLRTGRQRCANRKLGRICETLYRLEGPLI